MPKLNAALLKGKGPKAFAPATGSPNYAATESVYAKSESDARYPAVDTVYTKDESDNKFMGRTRPQVLSTFFSAGNSAGTIRSSTLTAPGNGKLVVTLIGQCQDIGTTGGTVTLKLEIDAFSVTDTVGDGITGDHSVGYNLSWGIDVTSGASYAIKTSWTKTNNGATLFGPSLNATVLVTWVPTITVIFPGADR